LRFLSLRMTRSGVETSDLSN